MTLKTLFRPRQNRKAVKTVVVTEKSVTDEKSDTVGSLDFTGFVSFVSFVTLLYIS
jgi:hypothetical protein